MAVPLLAMAGGAVGGEGVVAADEDGLVRLVVALGSEVRACVEMMSGAIWVRDTLVSAGWEVQIAHARKVRDVAQSGAIVEMCRVASTPPSGPGFSRSWMPVDLGTGAESP